MELFKEALLPFVSFKTSRSGGKGGQNVNKVSSKVELNFDLNRSGFSDEQKGRLFAKLSSRLTADGQIQVISEEERSQYLNKEKSIEKLIHVLKNALHEPAKRKVRKIPRAVIEKRLKDKQQRSEKKANRQKFFD